LGNFSRVSAAGRNQRAENRPRNFCRHHGQQQPTWPGQIPARRLCSRYGGEEGQRAFQCLRAGANGRPGRVDKDNLEVVLHRDYSLDDGRYANNGWLQELPDPITKIVWDNAVLVSARLRARSMS